MAIAGQGKKETSPKPKTRRKRKTDNNIRTAAIVDKDTTILKMEKYISGSRWTVDYYSQISAEDDSLHTFDTDLPNPEQQYQLIRNSDLTVTTPLETQKMEDVTGEAKVHHNIKPQVGDMFKAKIISGEHALFRVTNVTSQSYNLNNIYTIEYAIDTTELIDNFRFKEIEKRVVRVFYYNADSLFTESDQLLLEEDAHWYDTLKDLSVSLPKIYLDRFLTYKTSLITVTIGDRIIYDPNINILFKSVTESSLLSKITFKGPVHKNGLLDRLLEVGRILKYDKAYLLPAYRFRTIDIYGVRTRIHFPKEITDIVILEDIGTPFRMPITTEGIIDETMSSNHYLLKKNGGGVLDFLFEEYDTGKALTREKLLKLMAAVREDTPETYWLLPMLLLLIRYELSRVYSLT